MPSKPEDFDMYGNPKLTDEQFEAALETLGIKRTMDRFPMRLTRKQLDILGELIFADETPEEREERLKTWPHKRLT